MDYFYVYVLRSVADNRSYTGYTTDIEKRLKKHNSGRVSSTKPYVPWELFFIERYEDKFEALTREKFLKTGKGREYIKKYWPRSSTE